MAGVAGEESPVAAAVKVFGSGLDGLLAALDEGGLGQVDDAGLVQVMQGFERVRNRMALVDHRWIGAAEQRSLAESLCQGSTRRMLTSVLRLSRGEAARRVRAAEAVGPRTSVLGRPLSPVRPCLAAAQAAGEVSPEQVAIVERAIGSVDRRGFDPADVAAGEALLTSHAHTFAPEPLRQLAEQVVNAIDPDGTLPNDEVNADRRHFHLRPTRDGAYVGEFRLTGAAGAKLAALLEPLAKIRPTCPNPDATRDTTVLVDWHCRAQPGPVGASPSGELDVRTRGQRWHDALEEVCDRMLRCGGVPDAGGVPATVIVTITVEDLMSRAGIGHTGDGATLSTRAVLDLAAEAEVIPVVLNRAGAVLDLGRSRRIATSSQSLALAARDRGCSFPGCDRAPQWCERHHIIAWIDGGWTDLNNLTLLCVYHHHHFLDRGWTCRINADQIPEWLPPRWVDPDQTPQVNTRIRAALAARTYARDRRLYPVVVHPPRTGATKAGATKTGPRSAQADLLTIT